MNNSKVNSSNDWLDQVMVKLRDVRNDAQLAKRIQMSPQLISSKRKANNAMSLEMAVKLAEVLEVNPLKILLSSMYSHAKEEDKDFWQAMYTKYVIEAEKKINADQCTLPASLPEDKNTPTQDSISQLSRQVQELSLKIDVFQKEVEILKLSVFSKQSEQICAHSPS